jgi:hypothetical protein
LALSMESAGHAKPGSAGPRGGLANLGTFDGANVESLTNLLPVLHFSPESNPQVPEESVVEVHPGISIVPQTFLELESRSEDSPE